MRFIDTLKEKDNLFSILCLVVFCVFIFFAFLGSYPLIDVDETRYVRIAQEMLNAHNYLTPVINGELFLEKPPLYFWLEDLSFILFGRVNEWTARMPMALVASFGVFMTYYFGKKFVSNRFGLISALVLGSNVLYIVLSHIAILDLLLSVTMMCSAYFGIMTLFSQGKQNWICWFGFYSFCSLSALAKGLPGLILPFAIVFFAYLFSKRLKELFDFRKIGLGFLLILLIILPWHLLMYKVHGQAFWDEYIIKHHVARFFSSEGINRKESFFFFVPVLLIGFVPFVFTLVTSLVNEFIKIFKNFNNGFNFNLYKFFSPDVVMSRRFLAINILTFCVIFLFFSVSSTKLPTYILPATFPLAFITGYIFDEYLNENKFNIQILISNWILSAIFGLAAIAAVVSIVFFAPKYEIISEMKPILITAILLFGSYSCFNIYSMLKNKSQNLFCMSNIVFMTLLTIILNLQIFNFVVSFGEKDLIDYSVYAKKHEQKLATFGFGYRYSVIYYYGSHVDIQEEAQFDWLQQKLNENYAVILKNKNIISMPPEIKYAVIESGKKYMLVKKVEETE